MLLDVSANDLRSDFITYCASKIAIFPELPTPQAPLDSWELAKDGPSTQTLEACHNLRDGVPGREGAKDMHMVRTHLHFLNGDVILLRNIGKELPDPLWDFALQDVSPVLGPACAFEQKVTVLPLMVTRPWYMWLIPARYPQ